MRSLIMCFLVAMVGLVSCDKDDEKPTTTTAGIEGTWQYTKEGGIVGGVEMLTDFPHAAGCTKDYWKPSSDGTYSDHTFEGTGCAETIFNGIWTRSGSIITCVEAGETVQIEILSLTDTTLKTKEIFEGEILVTVYTKI